MLAKSLATFRNATRLFRLDLSRLQVLALDRVVHLAAVDRDFARSFDTEANPIAANIYDRDDHVVADDDAFVALSGENQHISLFRAQRVIQALLGNRCGARSARPTELPVLK
jgi:hypothetical protein